MKFLTSIDLTQNELQNAVIQNLATSPANPKEGQIYYDTVEHTLYQYKGQDGWKPVGIEYTLPTASNTTLGGVKVGSGLTINGQGVLSTTGGGLADQVEWTGVLNTPTTLEGYGIVDAKIENNVITLGESTITPLIYARIGIQQDAFEAWTCSATKEELDNMYASCYQNMQGVCIAKITPYSPYNKRVSYYAILNSVDTSSRTGGNKYNFVVIGNDSMGEGRYVNEVITLDCTSDSVVVTSKKHTFLTAESTNLTTYEQQTFRTNIGAGTSNFSGSYNDLTDKPTIDAELSTTSTNAVENKAITTELNKKYSADNEPPYPVTSVDGAKGAVVLNDVKYTEQTLNDTQKAQARKNIGAGTSNFSGAYNDLTGKPTVDTTMSADSTNAVQNKVIKAYVDGIVAASQGIVYKGTINQGSDVPKTYDVGWLYMIAAAGTYVGQKCEVGDLMIAVVKRTGTGNQNSDWDVIQTNIDGAITEITGDAPISITGTGANREVSLDNSGVTTGGYGDTVAQTPTFGATFKVPSFTVDQYGRLTVAGEHNVTIPNVVASDTVDGLMDHGDYTLLHMVANKLNDAEDRIALLHSNMVTKGTATLSVGDTNTTITIPTGKVPVSATFKNATSGEAVMCDYSFNATTGALTVSIASAVTYDITITYTYM